MFDFLGATEIFALWTILKYGNKEKHKLNYINKQFNSIWLSYFMQVDVCIYQLLMTFKVCDFHTLIKSFFDIQCSNTNFVFL